MNHLTKEEQRAIVFPFASSSKNSQAILCLGQEAWDAVKKTLVHAKEKRFSFCKMIETPHFFCVGPVVGSPAAVLALEQMIASGAKNIFALGCAGSLQANLLIGNCLLAHKAISEEGTSAHYNLDEKEPCASQKSLCFIRKILQEQKICFQEGVVWTIDAPYRELVWKVKKYQNQNVAAVEMETSALYTVAKFRNISLCTILVISDELFTYQWKKGFHSPIFKEKFALLAHSIIDGLEPRALQ